MGRSFTSATLNFARGVVRGTPKRFVRNVVMRSNNKINQMILIMEMITVKMMMMTTKMAHHSICAAVASVLGRSIQNVRERQSITQGIRSPS